MYIALCKTAFSEKVVDASARTLTPPLSLDFQKSLSIWRFSHFQYGTLEKAGIVDFYPGMKSRGYGRYQPGCRDSIDVLDSCSHSKSHEYYVASLKDAVCLASR